MVYNNSGVITHTLPPAGYDVDFANPLRRAVPDVYYIAGVGCFFSLLSMLQRFYTKLVLDKTFQADDWLLLMAWITSSTVIGLTLYTFVMTYAGVHAWEVPEFNYCLLLFMSYISWTIYIAACSFAKLSLLAFYLRLSPQRWFKILVWISIGFIISYTVALIPVMTLACKFVDGRLGNNEKMTCPTVNMVNAILNVFTDVVLLVLPIPMVLQLQVRTIQKVGCLLIFTVGGATIITSIIRAVVVPRMTRTIDQTWEVTYVSIWIIIEGNLLVMCAALPTLRKFFRNTAPRSLVKSLYGSSKDQASSHQTPSSSNRGPTLVTIGGGGPDRKPQRPSPVEQFVTLSDSESGSSESFPIQDFSARPSYVSDGSIRLEFQGVGIAK